MLEELESKSYLVVALLVFSGALIGSAFTYHSSQQQMDDLRQQVEEDDIDRVVYQNGTEGFSYLFNQVQDSVVSVRAYGGENSQGSGFVYSRDGYIVTNEHVIAGADRVEVEFSTGNSYNARIVGTDPYSDLAVLRVSRRNLDPLELGTLSEVEVGQRAVAIGNPFGLPGTMTAGIISQKGRTLPVQGGFSIPNVLQTDAAINPGNSGGPLMNTEGEVVGVNTAIETNTGTFSGVGFAIPVSAVKNIVPEIIQEGEFDHPWIGVEGVDVSSEIADEMDLETTRGFLVLGVVEGSPADEAGLRAGNRTVMINGREMNVGGDVIIAIDGERMNGINDILRYLAVETEVGEEVEIGVIRDGERRNVSLTLAARSSR